MSIAGLNGGIVGPTNFLSGVGGDLVGAIIGLVGPNALGTHGGIVAPWKVTQILPPGTGPKLDFSNATGSMYLPLFGGFA